MNKQEKINLLLRVFNGTIPASALRTNKLIYFHQITDDQRAQVEAIVGGVVENEKILGLWDGVPIGLTLLFQRGLLDHCDAPVKLINCESEIKWNEFLTTLKNE